jgi:hypothetical protein
MTSHEIAAAAADLATVEALRDRVRALEADNAELREKAERAETQRKAWTEIGAQAQAELEAARAVVAAARDTQDGWPHLTKALLDYDAVVKAT